MNDTVNIYILIIILNGISLNKNYQLITQLIALKETN